MHRRLVVSLIIVLIGLTTAFVWIRDRMAEADDQLSGLVSWQPDAGALRQALAPTAGKAGTPDETARHRQFAHLFQNRFRNHQPPIAVGMRFVEEIHRIKLMCPARMEPWDMDRVALCAWQETHNVFGRAYDIDIFETFIGTAPVKVGVLHAAPNRPDVAQIAYDYPSLLRAKPNLTRHAAMNYE
jgi:hypothetical protein